MVECGREENRVWDADLRVHGVQLEHAAIPCGFIGHDHGLPQTMRGAPCPHTESCRGQWALRVDRAHDRARAAKVLIGTNSTFALASLVPIRLRAWSLCDISRSLVLASTQ